MSVVSRQRTQVNKQQAIATNPELSIWVSANAGSGKTYVLSRRVIRLLLEGNKPSELLCLTFTKAAAAEMSNRVFEILGQWAMKPDDELADAIAEITDKPTTTKDVVRARKLFAIALDTPGGLRIQTIHAFCESLLHQFPLEANIPGHFEMMNDLDQKSLIEQARKNTILMSLRDDPSSQKLSNAFTVLRDHASDTAIEEGINHLIHDRDEFNEWIRRGGGEANSAFSVAWEKFDLTSDTSINSLYEEFSDQTSYSISDLEVLIALASAKTAAGYKTLIDQLNAINQCADKKLQHQLRCDVFLTTKLEKRKSLVHSSFLKDEPYQLGLFEAEQTLLLEQLNRIKMLGVLRSSEALFTIAETILLEYARLKQKRSMLDFSDLISKTAHLLGRYEISSWVQYKLDNGISHVLVDEAQDTSPLQWKIIEAITTEFYAGKGVNEKIRTTFVVGDEKQSIYSFQGADPKEFNIQFRNLMKKSDAAQLGFKSVPLTVSFRSTEEVLSAVDQVFSLPENAKGLSEVESVKTHSANRLSDRGEVILWDPEIKPKRLEKTDWRLPPGDPEEAEAEIRLANKIAGTIKTWIETNEKLPGQDRPIRNGDILILVRKRDRFVSAINRALKQKGLVSAGADRLKLTEHIAVEDMLAIGRFAAMELDDLSLASILKSPLFDFSEEELFDVCHGRNKTSLYANLTRISTQDPPLELRSETYEKIVHCVHVLKLIRKNASQLPVYDFYARLFAKTDLRKKYHGRLGHEVEEIFEGFFQAALNHDNQNGLGLQNFIETMALTKPELKREVDMERDEIRVITTHSSKGLEAPIIFLVDPCTKAFDTRHAPAVIKYPSVPGNDLYLWQPKKSDPLIETKSVYEEIEQEAENEYRRLLYVGMTRAADRLIVCGYRKETPPSYPHWYQMIEDGLSAPACDPSLKGRLEPIVSSNGDVNARQWIIDNPNYRSKALKKKTSVATDAKTRMVEWIKPVPPEPAPPRPLSPSGVLSMLNISEEREFPTHADSDFSLNRGNAVHHLLQILPNVKVENREAVADSYFQSSEFSFPSEIQANIKKMIFAMLEKPDVKALFSPNSKSEIEISGKVKIGDNLHMVRGKIDRLVIEDETITIADYKTNQYVPNNETDVSTDYLAQLALYRQLVRNLYPHKDIQCFLVWTQDASMMKISDQLLDQQIERIMAHTQQVVSV